ncbi:MAG: hypothetical protein HQL79_04310 [Magnetococcales bacterium]|nr:hypothetical protein [Magnetococcales bacterium]
MAQITAHVSEYVKLHLTEWMAERNMGKSLPMYEIEIRERVIRVEEELRHQRELMQQWFEQVDKRLEQVDKRFEQVDKRFEQLERRLDARFENLIRRLDRFMIWSFGLTVTMAGIIISVLKLWR